MQVKENTFVSFNCFDGFTLNNVIGCMPANSYHKLILEKQFAPI